MRRVALLLVGLLWLTAACGRLSPQSPTPFPTPGASPSPTGQGPVALTIPELAAAQGLYLDTLIQLSGRFGKQPVLACDEEKHLSPASWALVEEGITIPAGGFDDQVRALLPNNLLMSVEGRWRRWEGLVGCGKQATQREVWFLDVTRILSPSPLTMVTLTPGGVGGGPTEVAGLPPTAEGQVTIEVLPTLDLGGFPTPLPEATDETPTPDPFAGEPTVSPTTVLPTLAVTTPTLPTGGTPGLLTPSPTTSGTPGTPSGTASPTVTGTPPTATATTTGITATPGAPGTPGGEFDLFDVLESLGMAQLQAGTFDRWTGEFSEGEAFEVFAIAPAPADIVLSLVNGSQTVVSPQNTAPAGSPEMLTAGDLPADGDYTVQVGTVNNVATQYAIYISYDEELPVAFNGFIIPGSPRTAVQLPIDATHFWFFNATAGDEVTISLTSDGASDPAFDLYSMSGDDDVTQDDDSVGGAEVLVIELSETGMFAISVYNWEVGAMIYDLSVTIN